MTALQNTLASSGASLEALRQAATRDPQAAVKESARQFEALFMNELLKSMRATTQGDGLFDNSGTEMGTQMLDQQYAMQLSGQPGGLGDLIARQLSRQIGTPVETAGAAAATPAAPAASVPLTAPKLAPSLPSPAAPAAAPRIPQKAYAEDFVRRHSAAAESAAARTGIPASFILAQAAHESGWGRKEIRNADGSTSFNVFGIKATPGWKGATTEVATTEYINGQARKVTQSFRAYGSYEEAFQDWARLLKESPRYAGVVQQADGDGQKFAQNLQRAGYATDPQYADKLGRVINTTLRLQRAINV